MATADDALQAAGEFLWSNPAPPPDALPETADEGFVRVVVGGFDGMIHWRGDRYSGRARLHAPGRCLELLPSDEGFAIDLPGHGLSDDFQATDLTAWARVVAAALTATSKALVRSICGEGASSMLALAAGALLGSRVDAEAAHVPQPEATGAWLDSWPRRDPDRFGAYLAEAWQAVRASHFFWPWFRPSAQMAIPFEAEHISPRHLALEHRALLRARGGGTLLAAALSADRKRLLSNASKVGVWGLADWARGRPDVWRPPARELRDR